VQGGPGHRYAKVNETGETEGGLIFRGDVGLEVTISAALGLRVGHQVRHNTDVPPGVDKTDTLTAVGLLYETK
jgi:putative salt-induced outer membrane protein YdiY